MGSIVRLAPADIFSYTVPPATALSNGEYTVVLSATGTGYSALGSTRLTRWVPDPLRDAGGTFVYARDEESGDAWPLSLRPAGTVPDDYTMEFAPGMARMRRDVHEIESTVEVCVAPDVNVELRRITLANRGAHARTLSITTYAEAVLNTAAADAGHPAFSKLFVQTAQSSDGEGVLASRRLRSPDDEPAWIEHRLVRLDAPSGSVECETDRMRFIGRGRSLAHPRALERGANLSGTSGAVLDPVLSLRRRLRLEPGAEATFLAAFAAGRAHDIVAQLAESYVDARVIDETFAAALARGEQVLGDRARSATSLRSVAAAVGVLAYGDGVRAPFDPEADETVDDRLLFARANEISVFPVANGGRAPKAPFVMTRPIDVIEVAGASRSAGEPLEFFNGYGGFAGDGTEYVIRRGDGTLLPPAPWTNVIANDRVGFIVSETGAACTWSANSRTNRLTPWFNDPVRDPHGEALYLRDDDTDEVWSPTGGPACGNGTFETRHGFGYSTFRHSAAGLDEEVTTFVPRSDPLRISRVRITNRGTAPRRLTLVSYAELVLGDASWNTAATTTINVADGVVRASNEENPAFASLVAFAAQVSESAFARGVLTDARAFVGDDGDLCKPAALSARSWNRDPELRPTRPCAAFATPLEIGPGETAECAVLLGQAEDAEVRELLGKYASPDEIDRALDEAIGFWRDLLGRVKIETPSREIDIMVNGWLTYQNLSCRIWGRSAFYQSGGAYGFRDQLQDTLALIHLSPERAREQIIMHASHQFEEGDVLHWWHPPTDAGIRTGFSDDLVWLPYAAATYVGATGDSSLLDAEAPYVSARPRPRDEDEIFVHPTTGRAASVYEHCCRAIDRSLELGVHGIPLMGTGDWNDGMNRVGREGRGESVWLGFFIAWVLDRFVPLCESRGDIVRADAYRAHRAALDTALNDAGWDGEWYRRAYYDDGTPLGTSQGDECRIDAIAQAWSVISCVAPSERAVKALDSLERHLVSERDSIIRLLTPAFDRTPHDPGYIKGYVPGVRENGGQYTHAALWAVKALAEAGRTERAAPLLAMLSPISHAGTADAVERYRTEPYVIAADVYGVAPHVGRGGWSWYTGSAGWMYRVALESVLGIEIVDGDTLRVRPCVPSSWPGFSVRYRLADGVTEYSIVVSRSETGVTTARLDCETSAVTLDDGAVSVALVMDGLPHALSIELGEVRSTYAVSLARTASASDSP